MNALMPPAPMKALMPPAVESAELLPRTDFTPGPWQVYNNGFFYDIKVPWQGRSVVEAHSPSLCQVFYEGCDGVMGLPNARLIAATPELLIELRAIAREAVAVKTPEDNEQFRARVFERAQRALRLVELKEVLRAPGVSHAKGVISA